MLTLNKPTKTIPLSEGISREKASVSTTPRLVSYIKPKQLDFSFSTVGEIFAFQSPDSPSQSRIFCKRGKFSSLQS